MSDLSELAAAYGVATDYWDWQGRHVPVADTTVRAVLQALGVDAGDPAAALTRQRLKRWRRMLPPCVVTRSGRPVNVPVHVPHGDPVQVEVELEDGTRRHDVLQLMVWVDPVEVDGRLTGEATFQTPLDLPLGWHTLHARAPGAQASCPLVVTPAWLGLPEGLRTWGLMVQLYSVRSRSSWSTGDLADLRTLAEWSARDHGAGMLLVNPLHAAAPVAPRDPSPYYPASRRFADPLYLRVEDVPEAEALPAADRRRIEDLAAPLRAANGTDAPLDRDAVWAAKAAALELVHRVPRTPERQAAYDAFRTREGDGLREFATWCALAERHGADWRAWPTELRRPATAEVARARDELADRVDFHAWCQWLLDEQLAAAQRAARAAGMPLGIVHDLAVGVSPDSADAWALQDCLALGVTVGAPPDAFNQLGQDWLQPPWRPDRLAELGYAPFRDLVRGALRSGGGLRVDHVIGLFRLWWVPEGATPDRGAYVRYDPEALVGVLALEAARAGAVVIGEDLGVVQPEARDYLRERGILGTSVLWFERGPDERPLRPERWRELALATVTTHDLPTTLGFLRGEHVALRERLGLLTRPAAEERAAAARERREWEALLRELGLLAGAGGGGSSPPEEDVAEEDVAEEDVVVALHALLARTPCRLIGVSLPDAVGDLRQQNQPGTIDEYPNWRLPLADGSGRPVLIEDLPSLPLPGRLARAVGGR
ncbi:MAG: 4-alpha-glucanotransferase [Mycobacterium leprae]